MSNKKAPFKFSEGDAAIHTKAGKVMTIKSFDYKINKYQFYSENGTYEGSFKQAEPGIYQV